LERPEWCVDPRFASAIGRVQNMNELDHAIGELTSQKTKADLCARLVEARVPCAPVRELAEVVDDPHLHEVGMLQWFEHPELGRILVHRSPLVFKDEAPAPYQASRSLGADTQAVLEELCGYDGDRISQLRQQGAFAPVTRDKKE
jgi:formyl-CoA transferase